MPEKQIKTIEEQITKEASKFGELVAQEKIRKCVTKKMGRFGKLRQAPEEAIENCTTWKLKKPRPAKKDYARLKEISGLTAAEKINEEAGDWAKATKAIYKSGKKSMKTAFYRKITEINTSKTGVSLKPNEAEKASVTMPTAVENARIEFTEAVHAGNVLKDVTKPLVSAETHPKTKIQAGSEKEDIIVDTTIPETTIFLKNNVPLETKDCIDTKVPCGLFSRLTPIDTAKQNLKTMGVFGKPASEIVKKGIGIDRAREMMGIKNPLSFSCKTTKQVMEALKYSSSGYIYPTIDNIAKLTGVGDFCTIKKSGETVGVLITDNLRSGLTQKNFTIKELGLDDEQIKNKIKSVLKIKITGEELKEEKETEEEGETDEEGEEE